MWIAIVAGLLIASILLIRRPSFGREGIRTGRISFYAKGSDAGFSMAEITLLWRAASQARLPNPSALYGSIEELDKTINVIAGDRKFSDRESDDPDTRLLRKLFEYRKQVELSRPRYRSGLKTTRDISPGQRVKIRTEGMSVYTSEVVEITPKYLTITVPHGDPTPPGFSWRQAKLNIYFWRKDDAGYFFQSTILAKFHDKDHRYLRMYHSDNVLRSQKRQSIRAPAKISARLYPLKSLELIDDLMEAEPGLVCLIVDISEDGAAIQIGGRGRKNLPFKLQFKIREEYVVVAGLIKRLRYDASEDVSTLHVEFLPQPEPTRMIINSYVYDIDRSRAKAEEVQTLQAVEAFKRDTETKAPPVPDNIDEEKKEDEESLEELETVDDDEAPPDSGPTLRDMRNAPKEEEV